MEQRGALRIIKRVVERYLKLVVLTQCRDAKFMDRVVHTFIDGKSGQWTDTSVYRNSDPDLLVFEFLVPDVSTDLAIRGCRRSNQHCRSKLVLCRPDHTPGFTLAEPTSNSNQRVLAERSFCFHWIYSSALSTALMDWNALEME